MEYENRELAQNETELEKLKKDDAENSASLFNLLFLGGLLTAVFVLFMVFGGNENSEYSGLNGLSFKTFFSGEYSAHISEKFSTKQDFRNKVDYAKDLVKYCFGLKNKISPLSSGNFSSLTTSTGGNTSVNNMQIADGRDSKGGDAPNGVREEKIISQTETAQTSASENTTVKKKKKSESKKEESSQTTPTALTRPSETRETYWWEAPEETTGQKDLTVTMPPETNNDPPE